MSQNYKVKWSLAGPFRKDTVFTTEQANEAGMSDIDRHLKLGAIEKTDDDATVEADASAPHNTKGDNVDLGSGETAVERNRRREQLSGTALPGNVGEALPETPAKVTGDPGKVETVTRHSHTAKKSEK